MCPGMYPAVCYRYSRLLSGRREERVVSSNQPHRQSAYRCTAGCWASQSRQTQRYNSL